MPDAEDAAGESHRAEPRHAASYVSMPPRHKLIWVSPRTSMSASDLLRPAPFGRFLLHQVADRMTSLYDEFTQAHLAVLEIPPAAEVRYELRMLSIVKRILHAGPRVAVIVRPNMRRKSDRATWVHRWNRMRSTPFRFKKTCSCKLGNGVPGCHSIIYVGTSWRFDVAPCSHLPSLDLITSARDLILAHATFSMIMGKQRGTNVPEHQERATRLQPCSRGRASIKL